MEVSRIRALRGPNLWTRHTAIEALVRCEGKELDLSAHADFETHLRHLFPGLGQLSPTDRKVPLSMAHAKGGRREHHRFARHKGQIIFNSQD